MLRFASETAAQGHRKGQAINSPRALAPSPAGSSAVLHSISGRIRVVPLLRSKICSADRKDRRRATSTTGTSSLKVKFEEKTPDDVNQAIQTLKETAQKYASFVPGGQRIRRQCF